MGKKKVIIDTNVLISALGWGGKSYDVVDLGFASAFRWIISKPIFEELIITLSYPKLDFISKEELEQKFVDPKDVMFLECALEIDANYLVSRDNHLLELGSIGNTKIISPENFLSLLK